MLHVTPRTIRYWVSGRVTVPYAAFRLLRVMRLFELPMSGWEGWHMHSGKLWSPEGHGFIPSDSSWWGLLVRKAALFGEMYERDRQLDIAMQRTVNGPVGLTQAGPTARAEPDVGPVASDAPTGEAGRAAKPPGLNSSLKHFGTRIKDFSPPPLEKPVLAGLVSTADMGGRNV